jgi:mannonate dehydratase
LIEIIHIMKISLLPEYPHILDYDKEAPGGTRGGACGVGGGGYAADVFNIAFTRGLMWAVKSSA